MTLIEILHEYKQQVHMFGRLHADRWLQAVCSEELWDHIQSSVDSQGNFIDAEGYRFNP